MATPSFGQPVYDDEQHAQSTGANGAAHPDETPVEVLDPNDPALTSEVIDVNQDADAYAQPQPPPDKIWRARLKIMKPKVDGKEVEAGYIPKSHKSGQKYYATGIEATLVDGTGKFDGSKAFDSWVGTFIGKDGGTKISTILSKLKKADGKPWVEPGARLSHKDWMDVFQKALAGEPEVAIETQWEWSCQGCGEEAKKNGKDYPRSITGMYKFGASRKERGAFDPEMKCLVNPAHGYSRARVRIASVMSLAEAKV